MWNVQFFDKELVCEQCHSTFMWGAGEQEFYAVMGFDNPPRRCPECRKERRLIMQKKVSIKYEVKCAKCGELTSVPFVPHQGRPVYCRDCYAELHAPAEAA